MSQLIFKHISEALSDYDLFLFDLWGVIVENDELYPGVVESINGILKSKPGIFVSNAPRPAFIIKERLKNWGLQGVTEEMIVTSGDIARSLMVQHARSLEARRPVIYHLGDLGNDDILKGIEHIITDDHNKADIFLLSLHRDENQDIREFDELLKEVAKQPELLKICANPDVSIPRGGITRYCAGYFAQIIEENGGKVVYTGKPGKVIYERVLEKAPGIRKDRILMIGDTFETDILGARNASISSALVMTGNARKFHEAYKTLEAKLLALGAKAAELDIFPNFVTELS